MATYEEVKDVPNHPEKYLFDVRNESELKETGVLPASINIPCEQRQSPGITGLMDTPLLYFQWLNWRRL